MPKFRSGAWGTLLLVASAIPALAQNLPAPPGAPGRNPACTRLEAQLSAIDRGGTADPARAEQIRRYEEAAGKQQAELDKVLGQSRRAGCQGSGFFSLFTGQPAQCGQINTQIQQMRSNLDQILASLQQLQGNTAGREGARQSVLVALAQNDCGPQYRTAALPQQRGFFDTLFGPGSIMTSPVPADQYQSSAFRTVCVRTCDGFYFPISYSTSTERFADDEQKCQRMCPAAEVQLYTYRNPGEDMSQAVSLRGQAYTDLPTAFSYRKEVNRDCNCRRAGQTWADALKQLDDNTVEQGDIIVTDERAKQLSQPKVDAQGKRVDPRAAKPATPSTTTTTSDSATTEKRQVRTVGPPFVPTH